MNYHIPKPFDQGFPSNKNVTIGVPKLSFPESMFDTDHPVGALERLPLVRAEQKLVSHLKFLLSNFRPPGETVLDFCLGGGSTTNTYLSAPKHFKFFGREVDDSCNPQAMSSISELFPR